MRAGGRSYCSVTSICSRLWQSKQVVHITCFSSYVGFRFSHFTVLHVKIIVKGFTSLGFIVAEFGAPLSRLNRWGSLAHIAANDSNSGWGTGDALEVPKPRRKENMICPKT